MKIELKRKNKNKSRIIRDEQKKMLIIIEFFDNDFYIF